MRTMLRNINNRSHFHEVSSIDHYSKTTRLVMGAMLGSLAAILQSAGVFTGLGYVFSIMTTGPIVLATLISLRIGIMTYIVTIFLLAIIQPSELIVFPFTTGLLGVSLGIGLRILKNKLYILLFGAISLTLGIAFLLYVVKFPILGPSVTSEFKLIIPLTVLAFSCLYSWIWIRLSLSGLRLVQKVFLRKLDYEKHK